MKISDWFRKKQTEGGKAGPLLETGLHQPPYLDFSAETSNGKTRDHNEDSLFTYAFRGGGEAQACSIGLFMVADGMGGHLHGELASRTAIETASACLMEKVIKPLENGGNPLGTDEVKAAIEEAFLMAQEAVLSHAEGSGTTLTVLLIRDRQAEIGHVGDSRLYAQSRTGGLRCLTVDHSLVRRLVDLGQINASDALDHPQRNILFRALGQGDGFKVDLESFELEEATTFLLCSDGLWGLVDQNNLARLLRPGRQNTDTAARLVSLANEAGGTDNITAIVISLR